MEEESQSGRDEKSDVVVMGPMKAKGESHRGGKIFGAPHEDYERNQEEYAALTIQVYYRKWRHRVEEKNPELARKARRKKENAAGVPQKRRGFEGKVCSLCESRDIAVLCKDCEYRLFCKKCFDDEHSLGKRRLHKSMRLAEQNEVNRRAELEPEMRKIWETLEKSRFFLKEHLSKFLTTNTENLLTKKKFDRCVDLIPHLSLDQKAALIEFAARFVSRPAANASAPNEVDIDTELLLKKLAYLASNDLQGER
jgi:hypothetical protein